MINSHADLWVMKHKTIKGKPTQFASKENPYAFRPWQRQILNDNHPNVVVEKARQLGISELSVSQMLYYIFQYDPISISYIFPKNQQVSDFSKSRVAPVLAEPFFAQYMEDMDSVSLKKIKNSYIYFRSSYGSKGASNAEGVNGDMLYLDEYDRFAGGVYEAWKEGLKSSKYGYARCFSTPTLAGRGVNLLYSNSDQQRYFYKCTHCGEIQFLTYDDNLVQVNPNGYHPDTQTVDDGTFDIVCKKCKRTLDRSQIGEWMPLVPSAKDCRGYHISQLDALWISADQIMRNKFTYQSQQLFLNYVLGEVYEASGLTVTEADFRLSERCDGWKLSRDKDYVGIVAGIDWGLDSHMVILGIKSNGEVDLLDICVCYEDITDPLKPANYFAMVLLQYQPNCIIADAGYGAAYCSYLYTQFPDRFYSCHWTTSKDPQARIRFKDNYNENDHNVLVDKTVKMKRMLYALKNHLIGMPHWDEKLQKLYFHVSNVSILQEEQDGFIYEKVVKKGGNSPDHYACAMCYALIGVDKITDMGIVFRNKAMIEFWDTM